MNVAELTWYEDGSLIEWFYDIEDPEPHSTKFCMLRDAIEIAWKNQCLLVIQPMYQDECIFIDYSE